MPHNILLTGASGYLGGTVLARLDQSTFPSSSIGKFYALVRKPEQADQVKANYKDVEPLILDTSDSNTLTKTIIDHQITIVFYLIGVLKPDVQLVMIKALAEVKKQLGGNQEVHFLQTSGAKIFSSLVGMPTDKPLSDLDPKVYDLQKSCKGPWPPLNGAVETNNAVIDTAEAHGVRSYIFAPCIVYGEGEGFGNRISIQTVAIVKAARALKQVYKVKAGNPTWPVCHVIDNSTLYLQILHSILEGKKIGRGKNGYFLASPGSIAWNDLYQAMAKRLAEKKVVDDNSVKDATGNQEILDKMGKALDSPGGFVEVQLSGCCTFTANHGNEIGWKAQYKPEHILETADSEVDLILASL